MKTIEYDTQPSSPCIFEPIKIKVGPKVLRFTNKTATGMGSISFQKRSRYGENSIDIYVEREEKIMVPKTCSMGHTHEVQEKFKRVYEIIKLDIEHIEQFVDWIQNGNWKPVRKK